MTWCEAPLSRNQNELMSYNCSSIVRATSSFPLEDQSHWQEEYFEVEHIYEQYV